MKTISFTLCLTLIALITSTCIGQDFDNYQAILCKGALPKEMTTSSLEKYEAELAQEVREAKNSNQKAKEDFLLYQRYITDHLLKSGKVVVNADLTDYLNDIVGILLKDEPELRTKVHVYIMRSPSVNALALNDGTILICWGLLAQLDNEAQLAYVLSHEITHFKERHVLNQFKRGNFKKVKREQKNTLEDFKKNKNTEDEKMVAKYSYAKNLEFEADSLGLLRFIKTGYSLEAPEQTFDKLKYSYLPYGNLAFDKNFFQCKLPDNYFLDKVNPIKGLDESENDSLHSHPNLGSRKKAVRNTLDGKNMDGESFLVSVEKFLNLQKIARFELPQAYLHNQFFKEAFYSAYLLLADNPESYYLKAIIAKSLNGLVQESSNDAIVAENELEGEFQQIYHFFNNIPHKDLNLLALHYTWELHKKYPKKQELPTITSELFRKMVTDHYESMEDFELNEPEKNEFTLKKLIIPYLNDTTFTKYFAISQKAKEEEKAWEAKNKNNRYWAKWRNEHEKKGARLGIDRIVIINPKYHFLSETKQSIKDFIKVEEKTQNLQTVITDVANQSELSVESLSLMYLKSEDAEKLNDITLLSEWSEEQSHSKHLSIGTQQERIDSIASKYNTDYFLWIDVMDYKTVKPLNNLSPALLASLSITPFFLPSLVLGIINRNDISVMYATLYDVKTGRTYPLKRKYFYKKINNVILYSQIYDAFAQIKSHPKSKK